jgi:hypothetical protein
MLFRFFALHLPGVPKQSRIADVIVFNPLGVTLYVTVARLTSRLGTVCIGSVLVATDPAFALGTKSESAHD